MISDLGQIRPDGPSRRSGLTSRTRINRPGGSAGPSGETGRANVPARVDVPGARQPETGSTAPARLHGGTPCGPPRRAAGCVTRRAETAHGGTGGCHAIIKGGGVERRPTTPGGCTRAAKQDGRSEVCRASLRRARLGGDARLRSGAAHPLPDRSHRGWCRLGCDRRTPTPPPPCALPTLWTAPMYV